MAKLHKKLKVFEKQKLMHKMIPIYLMGYIVMKYLGYHTEWVLSGLSEAVGRNVQNPFDHTLTRPEPFSRYVLFRFLDRYQKFEPEAWLKNVEGVDVQECLKDIPPIENEPFINENRGNGGFNPMLFGFGADIMDEEAAIKMAIEMSQIDANNGQNQLMFEEPMI